MTSDIFDVHDKVVVLTGGMGQLGRTFSLMLADRGARVAILDLTVDTNAVAARFGVRAQDECFAFVDGDVTDRASLERALIRIEQRLGVPHALVNCAALDSPPNAPAEENGPFESYPEASWDRVMDVNLKGVFLANQVFGGRMARAGRGAVVNISSIYGVVSPNQGIYEYRRQAGEDFYKPVAYVASKSGLSNLTRYLATYWASRNVRVNTLVLAGVSNNQDARFLDAYLPHVPLGRMANPEDYFGALVFLCSDASAYMTGAELVVDGGWTAW
jgi:NAD(P)-dependent dehydrogenase (short-subunit alcohol dehydrogenase family)